HTSLNRAGTRDPHSVPTRRSSDLEETSIPINYDDLITDLKVGDRITVDNGLINLQVLSKDERIMRCRVIDGGVLKSKRHVNLPGDRKSTRLNSSHVKSSYAVFCLN